MKAKYITLLALAVSTLSLTSCMGLGFGIDDGVYDSGPYWYDGIYSPVWGPSTPPPPPFVGNGPGWIGGPGWNGGNPGPVIPPSHKPSQPPQTPPPSSSPGASQTHRPAFNTTPAGTQRPGNNGLPSGNNTKPVQPRGRNTN